MSDLRIAVHVDRDERAVDAGTTAGSLFDGNRAVVAARVNGVLRDLSPCRRGRRHGRAGGPGQRRRPDDHAALDRARARPGRPGPVPGGEAGDRAADRERLLLRLRRRPAVPPRGPGADRAAHAPDRQGGPALRPAGRLRRRGPRRAGRRALQAPDHRPAEPGQRRGGRRGRRRPAHHLRQPRPPDRRAPLAGPVPRPARPLHPGHPRLQAAALGGRVLARQRAEPAAPADLRHRMGVQGRARPAPPHARRGREAGPPAARGRARPVLVPGRDRLRPGRVPSQGRHRPPRDGGVLAPAARGGRVPVRQLAAHHQGDAVRDLRASRVVRREHVPAAGGRGQAVLPQADELPVPHPHLPLARPQLPRAAHAAVRVRHRVPVREVRACCTA